MKEEKIEKSGTRSDSHWLDGGEAPEIFKCATQYNGYCIEYNNVYVHI